MGKKGTKEKKQKIIMVDEHRLFSDISDNEIESLCGDSTDNNGIMKSQVVKVENSGQYLFLILWPW